MTNGPGAEMRRGIFFGKIGRGKLAAPGLTADKPPQNQNRAPPSWRGVETEGPPAHAGPARAMHLPEQSLRHGGRVLGCAAPCCGRLCKCVPPTMLTVGRLCITKDGSPTRRTALP
mgnify:CR=1 FL=1